MPAALHYAVSLHDVAPDTWPDCVPLLALCDAAAVPVTLLVVPEYHHGTAIDAAPAFAAALNDRRARGDDIVLHGYYHLDDGPPPRGPVEWLRRRRYTASEGEFDALDEATARQRLRDGRRRLEAIGCPPVGFIAPAWLLGPGGQRALDPSFGYTSSREHLWRLTDGRRVAAPSLVCSTRSAWRRAVSRRVLEWRLRALAAAPLVRVALHPADVRHASILDAWRSVLGRLDGHREALLEREYLARI